MIGVIAKPSDGDIVREFFELFKTPWEFYQESQRYDVVICAGSAASLPPSARLVIVYGADQTSLDQVGDRTTSSTSAAEVSCFGTRFPLYGSVAQFSHPGVTVLEGHRPGEATAYISRSGENWFARVGYNLFDEVRTLLTKGQPTQNASIPTLEVHIDLLRRLITGCGLPLVEIPPVPEGYSFIACLTHDLDHASIRRHKFDATMFGFLYRATVASAVNAARGRMPLKRLAANWVAAAKLPLVYLGLAEDFWYGFDRYVDLEGGRPSTFFVIPFEGRPGKGPNGKAPAARGAGYDVSHIGPKLQRLKAAGCEIGLHGIDAWTDKVRGREEADRISQVSEMPACGVRMHWLYADGESPAVLEDADFSYDSTVGYNETVGYRAGTGQVFKPLRASRLLELPLHVMDTALFYPDYLGLSDDEAWTWLAPLMDNAARRGGVLTFNWHDRSIAPERLWGDFYVQLLDELTRKGAVFCTAAQAVSWFRLRRSAVFEALADGVGLRVNVSERDPSVPALRLRLHRPMDSPASIASGAFEQNYTDTVLGDRTEFRFPIC